MKSGFMICLEILSPLRTRYVPYFFPSCRMIAEHKRVTSVTASDDKESNSKLNRSPSFCRPIRSSPLSSFPLSSFPAKSCDAP